MEKAIAQQSSVSTSDANTIAIISTLLSAQSTLAQVIQLIKPNFLSGEKVQVFYRMPTNIKFNLQIRRHYFNRYSTDNNLSTIWVNYIKLLQIYLNLRAICNLYPTINYGIPSGTKFSFQKCLLQCIEQLFQPIPGRCFSKINSFQQSLQQNCSQTADATQRQLC